MWKLLIIFLYVLTHFCEAHAVTVRTAYGRVQGSIATSRNGRKFASFKGIPFAKPPIGTLRFQPPQAPDNWLQPRNATRDGPQCIQKSYFFNYYNASVEGQEDCLYLNIYVPRVVQLEHVALPVMVFFHIGGLFPGHGTSDHFGPDYFMDRDIVLVIVNYRLGAFGFLSTVDDAAPGNNGFKDQVMALKFIKRNIEYFGGNPDRVTIFGQSLGGQSTSLHLISPLSKGLFHNAISQSGVSLAYWGYPLNDLQKQFTEIRAQHLGCGQHIGNSHALIACLQKIDAVTVANSIDVDKKLLNDPILLHGLVIETKTAANPEPFITKSPLQYFINGEFRKVPYILGNTQDEGIVRFSPIFRIPQFRQELNANFETYFPSLIYYQLITDNVPVLYQNVKDYYLGGNDFIDVNNPESVQGAIDAVTDPGFTYAVYQHVLLQSYHNHSPIWVYNFDYRGEFSFESLFAATEETIDFEWGVSHCDELLYLFASPGLFPKLSKPLDLKVSEKLLDLWTNFAIYGNPDPTSKIGWKPVHFSNLQEFKSENLNFLNITGSLQSNQVDCKNQKGYFVDRLNFWETQDLSIHFPTPY